MKHSKYFSIIIAILALLINSSCDNDTNTDVPTTQPAPAIPYTIVAKHKHDTNLFTEGLSFYNNKLWESTGAPEDMANTQTLIGYYDSSLQKFIKCIQLPKQQVFGEGIALLNNSIYQLTYKNKKCFVYDATTFTKTQEFNYANAEGWGLTTDGTQLYMSDGSDYISVIEPKTFTPIRSIQVTDQGIPIRNINELEYVNGFIYANVWMTNLIVKINPESGVILGKLDATSLAADAYTTNNNVDVLNGIAYHPTHNTLIVTGKLWPYLYELQLQAVQ
jgi:glutaminyl-peptide cyclotransferase